jgi:hypothetical protein
MPGRRQHAVLRALLEVQHELHRDPRAAGPARMRRPAAVADQIARIVVGSCGTVLMRRTVPIHIEHLRALLVGHAGEVAERHGAHGELLLHLRQMRSS